MEIEKIIQSIKQKTKIQINRKDIERALSAIKTTSSFWKIADISDLVFPALSELIKILKKEKILNVEKDKVILTEKGRKIFKELDISRISNLKCPCCKTYGMDFKKLKIEKKFLKIQKDKPKPLKEYDQGYVTAQTTLKRVSFAFSKGDLINKRVLILGDDDLVSIALGFLGVCKEIFVLDVDKRIINFIQKIKEKEKLKNINTLCWDLRKPLPSHLLSHFDTFFTDPSETLKALKLFIGRGLSSLKGEGCAGYFGLTRKEASLRKWLKFEKILLEFGAVITDIIYNFNEYINWDYIASTKAFRILPVKVLPNTLWYKSSFFRIELLKKVRWNPSFQNRKLYNDFESSTV